MSMRGIAEVGFRVILWGVYRAYKAEGLNALFLVLPAKLIAPSLARHGAQIGAGVEMHSPLVVHNANDTCGEHYANLQVGDDCYFGRDIFLDLADRIVLEDKVTVSMRVALLTHTHAGKSPLSEGSLAPHYAPVVLERGCYLGAGATVLPGARVGAEAIVGAGAVVTGDVSPGTTVAGVPAKVLERG